jgi:hypothetical protein
MRVGNDMLLRRESLEMLGARGLGLAVLLELAGLGIGDLTGVNRELGGTREGWDGDRQCVRRGESDEEGEGEGRRERWRQ